MKKKVDYMSPEINLLNYTADVLSISNEDDGVYLSYDKDGLNWD